MHQLSINANSIFSTSQARFLDIKFIANCCAINQLAMFPYNCYKQQVGKQAQHVQFLNFVMCTKDAQNQK
ncbi:unnamed protein product (macronuclear) [Paramecium tetraurelia]|uniref:Uncharacterized protein n=1 Tax=Paramecium tetraurelia TaxID=5888 RepID=A0CP06_PARTE|nr:uncharacterized protein GSPATT00038792001 [Paramecium tetraurelia]CAK72523.1 unnamed protein product [Paramecium tetraurelia]|eukprot:XP_001439920.1 hypothetical protein (macronuclear) [Paramecium tetraurelia strain d4-2]